jgi:hypothetical protein
LIATVDAYVNAISPFEYHFPLQGGTASGSDVVSEAYSESIVGATGTLKNMYVRIFETSGTPYSVTITLYKNGAPTSVTCTTSATTGANTSETCSDLVNTVSVSPGDTFAWVITPNTNISSAKVSVSVEFERP